MNKLTLLLSSVISFTNPTKGGSMKKDIYVDVDGTLLCGSHDALFAGRLAAGEDFGVVLDWYNSTHVADLAINWSLVNELKELKARGHKLILWTNRGDKQFSMTKDNLGDIWDMFEDYLFLDGGKRKLEPVKGHVYEDVEKYAQLGTEGYTLVSFVVKEKAAA